MRRNRLSLIASLLILAACQETASHKTTALKKTVLATVAAIPSKPAVDEAAKPADDQQLAAYNEAMKILDVYTGNPATLEEARQKVLGILKDDRAYARAYVALARVEYRAAYVNYDNYHPEGLQRAHKFLDHALKLDPALFDAFIMRGYVHLAENSYAYAAEAIDQAEAIEPGAVRAKLLRADLAFDRQESKEEQDIALETALDVLRSTDDPYLRIRAYDITGPIYEARRRMDLAEEAEKEALKLRPDSPWAHVNYAGFLLRKGDIDGAIRESEAALKIQEFGMARWTLSEAYFAKGADLWWNQKKFSEAGPWFEKSARNADNPNAYYGLGLFLRELARLQRDVRLLDKSGEAFEIALKIDPSHEQAKRELENHRRHIGKFESER